MDRPNQKLDFAIIGAQKAGTTALAQFLSQHDRLYFPPSKETHFFRRSPERLSDRPISHLLRHFKNAPPNSLLGDATPIYLYWPNSVELLQAHNRNMKLIITLRHPVARAFSGWSMERRRKRETLSFSDAIRIGRERVLSAPGGVHLIYSYVERGFYAEQIARVFKYFDRDQVFVMRSDDIDAARPILTNVQKFLGIEPKLLSPIIYNVNPSSLPVGPELEDDFRYLQTLYSEDIARTSELVDVDLSDWLVSPPLLPPAARVAKS